jgi:tetratricopeptide (TPR) repeat protein
MASLHTSHSAIFILQTIVSAFFAILFLQSGVDKIIDRRGNLEWLTGHFAKSPLAGLVGVLFSIITMMELAAGALSAIGCIMILLRHNSTIAFYGATLSALALLALFFVVPAGTISYNISGLLPMDLPTNHEESADTVRALESEVAKSPTRANLIALALVYIKSQQVNKAEALVAQALAIQPQDFEMRMLYGRVFRDQRKFAEAAREFNTVAQQEPDLAEAWIELLTVEFLAEHYPQALAGLDRVRALGAERPGHLYLRGIVLEHLRQRKAALEAYKRFLGAGGGKNPKEELEAGRRVRILEQQEGKR